MLMGYMSMLCKYYLPCNLPSVFAQQRTSGSLILEAADGFGRVSNRLEKLKSCQISEHKTSTYLVIYAQRLLLEDE